MYIGINNPRYSYSIKRENSKTIFESTSKENDIGVHIDPLLKFNLNFLEMIKKANRNKYICYYKKYYL